jgi:hypothetical protein
MNHAKFCSIYENRTTGMTEYRVKLYSHIVCPSECLSVFRDAPYTYFIFDHIHESRRKCRNGLKK